MNIHKVINKALILFAIITCFLVINSTAFAGTIGDSIQSDVEGLMQKAEVIEGHTGDSKYYYYVSFGEITNYVASGNLRYDATSGGFVYIYTEGNELKQVSVTINIESASDDFDGGTWMLADGNILVYVLGGQGLDSEYKDKESLKSFSYTASFTEPRRKNQNRTKW